MAPPGAESCLVLYPRAMMPSWRESKAGMVSVCDNIQETYQHMSANGVRFSSPPEKMGWGTYAKFTDPDGNEFVLEE